MAHSSRMLQPLAYGIAGMRAAEARVAARASNIVNAVSPGYRPLVPGQTTGAGGGPIVRVSRAELTGDFAYAGIAAEIVDMKAAKHAYRASAAVVHTADDMTRRLLDALA